MARVGSAQVITTATGAGADAYVQEDSGDTNFGSASTLLSVNQGDQSDPGNAKTYLKFDLSSITTPITSAYLELAVAMNDGGGTPLNSTPQEFTFHVFGLNDGSTAGNGFLGDDWTESGITWNNAPANYRTGSSTNSTVRIGTGTTNGGEAQLLGTFSINAVPGTNSLALSGDADSNIVNFLNSATNHQATFIITRGIFRSQGGTPTPTESTGESGFASKESTALAAPTLWVNQPVTGPQTTSVVSDETWRATGTQPAAGWNTSLSFDDSDSAGWADAVASTPGKDDICYESTVSGQAPSTAWFRHIFVLDAPVASATAYVHFDDNGEAYLNGHLLVDDTGGGATGFNLTIDPSYFNVGENLIAYEGINTIPPDNAIIAELNIVSVPEPATALGWGIATLLVLCRRRNPVESYGCC